MAFLTMEDSGRHARNPRSLAPHFPLQIGSILVAGMRRETSRVSFVMCPFCVRAMMPSQATPP
jgi:hypothetical protein